MLLLPRKSKYRREFRGKRRGIATRGHELSFGEYGLKSLGRGWITSRQLEAARKAIVQYLKRGGKMWIRVFPNKPVTKKPSEVRMGKGKGMVDHYVAVVKPGRVLFELSGVEKEEARRAFELAAHKLPVKTRFMVLEAEDETK